MALHLSEAITITLTSIIMVFLVLVGLMLITMAFEYIFKEEASRQAPASKPAVAETKAAGTQPANKDPKMVAALTALIVANEEDTDKNYTVTSVKRIH